jgi:hypothetical protein
MAQEPFRLQTIGMAGFEHRKKLKGGRWSILCQSKKGSRARRFRWYRSFVNSGGRVEESEE